MRGGALAAVGLVLLSACASVPPGGGTAAEPWVWRGERRVAEWLEIPPGVTLRLEPGTVVRFAFVDRDGDGVGDAGLHVRGRLEAVGTAAAPVVLTSAEGDPQPGDWRGLVFDDSRGSRFEECRIQYAEHALHAHFSSAEVTRCRLERNVEGTRLGNSSFVIERCLVRDNASKGLNFFACANRIRRNLVTRNADGIFLFETDTRSVVEENNVFGNTRYDLRLGDFYRGGRALGPNWWGTRDRAAIRERIFDGEEDPAVGLVTLEPAAGPFETGWEREP